MYQTGTHGSVGGRLANQSSASYPIGVYSNPTATKLMVSPIVTYNISQILYVTAPQKQLP